MYIQEFFSVSLSLYFLLAETWIFLFRERPKEKQCERSIFYSFQTNFDYFSRIVSFFRFYGINVYIHANKFIVYGSMECYKLLLLIRCCFLRSQYFCFHFFYSLLRSLLFLDRVFFRWNLTWMCQQKYSNIIPDVCPSQCSKWIQNCSRTKIKQTNIVCWHQKVNAKRWGLSKNSNLKVFIKNKSAELRLHKNCLLAQQPFTCHRMYDCSTIIGQSSRTCICAK